MNLPGEKRSRIIAVAVREFAVNGYQRASLNTIVRQVGIAKGSLYQYFDNKEALFLYVFDRFTALVRQTLDDSISEAAKEDFWQLITGVLGAGIRFIDEQPDYYQIYLKVLFEPDVPHREELIAKVRLFSLDYFGSLCDAARSRGQIRVDVATPMVVFLLDSVLDRFLQGYARPYLDGGLALSRKSRREMQKEIDTVITVLRDGLRLQAGGDEVWK